MVFLRLGNLSKTQQSRIRYPSFFVLEQDADLRLPGSSKVPKPLFMVPFSQDKSFINRAEIFDSIDKHMKQDRRLALSGTGGIG